MYNLLTYLEIAAFISSIFAWNKIKTSKYMRLFPFVFLLIAVSELFGEYLAKVYHNNTWFYNIYDPIMFLLYFAIMYYSVNNKNFKKFIVIISIIYVLISVCSFSYYYQKEAFNELMYTCGTLILIICIVRKLYELLEDPVRLDFLKIPFFYSKSFSS